MNKIAAYLSPLLLSFIHAQTTLPEFDGVVNASEWSEAQQFSIKYEVQPGDNSPAPQKTTAYATYSSTDLYIGFVAEAEMSTLRSSIRNRDEGFQDDNVLIGFDTYGDGRYMIVLGANPEGNQMDIKILPTGGEDNYDVNFESKASKHPNAYHVELKIPFSNLQFKAAEEMKWKVVFARTTYTEDTRSQSINFPINRNNPCIICQTPEEIVLKNVKSKNRINLLPYVYGGLISDSCQQTECSKEEEMVMFLG